MHLRIACLFATGLLLSACGVPGHTQDPVLANRPLPVTFFAGRVLSVQPAAIGFADGAVGITAGPAPGVVLGLHAGPGYQPGGGRVGVAVGGIGVGPGIEAPAGALEYTIAMEGSPQIIQITQYVLPEDLQLSPPGGVIAPGAPVVVRMVGATGRVLPLSLIPPEFRTPSHIVQAPVPIGKQAVLLSPPRAPDRCAGPNPAVPCHLAYRVGP